jgi:Protein kinase domain/Carbohydrate binding domain/Putative zinc-finger
MTDSTRERFCLDPEESDRLARGDLSTGRRRQLERHIAACPPCRELVSTLIKLERDETGWRAHASPGTATIPADPAIELGSGSSLGRYRLIERLGEGSMGVVFSAHDAELDRKVGLKLLRADFSPLEQGQLRERIRREARAMAQMAHPNVVTVYDVGSWEDRIFIAMEMVEGQTLLQWLAHGARSWREVVAVFLSAGHGLAAAHAAGLVHRDFKPANVLIGDDGRVRVGDFGLAAFAAAAAPPIAGTAATLALSTVSRCTMRSVAGTPYYMSPEQLRGDAADARSDQFSFCVALYEAISGEHPFAGQNNAENLAASMRGRAVTPARPRSIPRWLHRVLVRGLSMDPGQRHPSMPALIASLSRDAARRWRATRAAALAVTLLLGGVLALRSTGGTPAELAPGGGGAGQRYDVAVFAGAPDVLDAYDREWVATQTDACESPRARCAIQTTNLLRGAGFDRPGRGWRATGSDGSVQLTWRAGVLRVATTGPNRSVAQEVPWIIAPGRSYYFGVQVRVPDGQPAVRGRLRLSGIGRSGAASSTTPFVARARWSPVAVTLSPKGHYYRFRAELVLDSAGSIEVDGAELSDAGLVDASFEDSSTVHRSAAWRPYNLPIEVQTRWLVTDAFDGIRALELRTARKDGSIAQDTLRSPLAGTTYTFFARLRAGAGASRVAGNLVLWSLGEEHRLAVTGFEVGRTWTEAEVNLDVEEPGSTALRAEVYLTTVGAPLEIDATRLVPAGLVNASFEAGASGWERPGGSAAAGVRHMTDPSPRGETALFEPGRSATGARNGAAWLRLSGRRPNASIAQDLDSPLAGTTYTFSAWVRAAPGSRPVSGALEIHAPGATHERGRTDFHVASEWTRVVTTLDLERDHGRLRVEVSMAQAGDQLDIDGARITGANVAAPPVRDPGSAPQ